MGQHEFQQQSLGMCQYLIISTEQRIIVDENSTENVVIHAADATGRAKIINPIFHSPGSVQILETNAPLGSRASEVASIHGHSLSAVFKSGKERTTTFQYQQYLEALSKN